MFYENNEIHKNNNSNRFNRVTHAGYPESFSDFDRCNKSFYYNDSSEKNYIIYKNKSNDSISSSCYSDELNIKETVDNSSIKEYDLRINKNIQDNISKEYNFKKILLSIILSDELQKNYTVKLNDKHKEIIKNMIILNSYFLENFESEFQNIQIINDKNFITIIIYFIKELYKILYNKKWIIYKSYYKNCRIILKFLYEVVINNIDDVYNRLDLIISFNFLIDSQIEFIQNY